MDKTYIDTVRLLLECAPIVFETPDFAMKGGTAINLFGEDLPRLSVDIDVVFTNHLATRNEALQSIASGIELIRERLAKYGLTAEVAHTKSGDESKLFVRRGDHQVKVEVNHVFRGTVLPVVASPISSTARDIFTVDLSVPCLARSELYGSKLVAAMDRQHPRDFFDVQGMFDHHGLTPEVVECFVCYLAGHNRPIHEVLFSRDHDMAMAFENEFVGMTRTPVTLNELEGVRRRLKEELPGSLSGAHQEFLLGMVKGEPDWKLMSCRHLEQLPAIRWKLQNLKKLKRSNPRKFAKQTEELETRFQ